MIERRIKAAKFPATKSPDSFDFKAIASLNKLPVLELARCEYIDKYQNIIALGPGGTGKTHVALGLGLAACQKGLKVRFITAASLVHELIEAVDERRLQRFQTESERQFCLNPVTSQHEPSALAVIILKTRGIDISRTRWSFPWSSHRLPLCHGRAIQPFGYFSRPGRDQDS